MDDFVKVEQPKVNVTTERGGNSVSGYMIQGALAIAGSYFTQQACTCRYF